MRASVKKVCFYCSVQTVVLVNSQKYKTMDNFKIILDPIAKKIGTFFCSIVCVSYIFVFVGTELKFSEHASLLSLFDLTLITHVYSSNIPLKFD